MLHASQFLFLVWKIIPWSHMPHITGGISNPRFNFCVSKEIKVLSMIILQIQFLVGWCGHKCSILHWGIDLQWRNALLIVDMYCSKFQFPLIAIVNNQCWTIFFLLKSILKTLCLHFLKQLAWTRVIGHYQST